MAGQQVVAQAMHAATGAATGGVKSMAQVADDVIARGKAGVLDRMVAHLEPHRQLAIGRHILADARVESTPAVRGPLAAIRAGLAHVHADDVGHATLLANVRTSIAQEIDRIDLKIPSKGYDGHPDYMVVGSVRENLNLLEALRVI